jgi:hypothetical protein
MRSGNSGRVRPVPPRHDDTGGKKAMNVEGATWHAIVLDPEPFAATKAQKVVDSVKWNGS